MGTAWIDEADRQVAHLEVIFNDNFHVAGGLFANVEKGSNFHFDQALVNDAEFWPPPGGEVIDAGMNIIMKNYRGALH